MLARSLVGGTTGDASARLRTGCCSTVALEGSFESDHGARSAADSIAVPPPSTLHPAGLRLVARHYDVLV